MVPDVITDPSQRLLAASLAAKEAARAHRLEGTTPDGLARAFFRDLQEHVAGQDPCV